MSPKTLEKKSGQEKPIQTPENEQAETIKKLTEELERQKTENSRLKAEMLEYQKNGVSGLRRREVFYKSIESALEEIAPEILENIELLSDKELAEKLASFDFEKLKSAKLSVLMSDLAYLSFVNKEGHAAGDSLLKRVGEVAKDELGSPEVGKSEKEAKFVAFRHGGDEFSGIIRDNLENAEKTAKEFELKIGKSKIEILEKYGLKPHIDVGVAHISEGLEAFKKLVALGAEIPGGDRLRKIQDLLVAIADHRSILNKVKTRIDYLMELKAKKPDAYRQVIDDLRKGALGTKDEEIDFLIQHNGVGDFINNKIKESIKHDLGDIELEKEIIQEIARREK